MISQNKFQHVVFAFFCAIITLFVLTSCESGYYEYEPDEPYDGYSDDYDQDCVDVGERVWVGDDDPDGLDADGDGWGCEWWP